MNRIALTGGIACGKSLVAKYLNEFGVETLDADDVVHALIPDPDERRRIAAEVFADPKKRGALEARIHPLVRKRLDAFLEEPRGSASRRVVIVPLLFETGWDGAYDTVVCVASKRETQIARMMEMRGYSRAEAEARLAAQWPVERKRELADFTIDNDGTPDELRVQVQRLVAQLPVDAASTVTRLFSIPTFLSSSALFLCLSSFAEPFVWEKLGPYLSHRCESAETSGRFYEETVNAFRTHADDVHGRFEWITPEHGLWQGEYWGKNMLARIAVARYRGDAARQRALVSAALAFVREFQRKDGYIGTYADAEFIVPKDPQKELMCWNLWGRKYTLWALVECAKTAGALGASDDRRTLLDSASRLMDQQIAMLKRRGLREIDTGCFDGVASASVLKPLLLLYRETRKDAYLVHAREIVASLDDPSPTNPPPNLVRNAFRAEPVHAWYPMAKTPIGERQHTKAYEIMSCYEGIVEFSRVTGERRPLEAAIRFADKVAKDEANAMGSVGFGDHFAHAAARNNGINELCDVLHWIRLCHELYGETREPRHLDRMEIAFYNAFLAGVKADGRWANHGVRSHGYGHFTSQHEVAMKFHECCVDNLPRIVETWSRAAVEEAKDGTVRVNFYDDAVYPLSDGTLTVSGNFPIGNEITVVLRAKRKREATFRRPVGVKDMRVTGGNGTWKIAFVREPVVVRETAAANPSLKPEDPEAFLFQMSDLKGAAKECPLRRKPGARVTYGPLILAKAARLGTSDAEVFAEPLAASPSGAVRLSMSDRRGTWTLTVKTEKGEKTLPVCPLATAESGAKSFSVWF